MKNDELKEIEFFIEVWQKGVPYRKKVKGFLLHDDPPTEDGELDASIATYYDEKFKEWNVIKLYNGCAIRSFPTLEETINWVSRYIKEFTVSWYGFLETIMATRLAIHFQSYEVIEDNETKEKKRKKKMNEEERKVKFIINQTLNYGKYSGLKSFINEDNELIVAPAINAYFRLDDIKTELDFKCKVLNWLSVYCTPNHWNKKWSYTMIDYINFILNVYFSKEDFETIYKYLGNGINNELTIKFIQGNYNLKILMENE